MIYWEEEDNKGLKKEFLRREIWIGTSVKQIGLVKDSWLEPCENWRTNGEVNWADQTEKSRKYEVWEEAVWCFLEGLYLKNYYHTGRLLNCLEVVPYMAPTGNNQRTYGGELIEYFLGRRKTSI